MVAATKAVMPMLPPFIGLILPLNNPMNTPDMPARMEPMTNARLRMDLTGMPICRAASGSCEVARMACPDLPNLRNAHSPSMETMASTTMTISEVPKRTPNSCRL
jgi:hypothetical protein